MNLRLAFRVEGNHWNAYVAEIGTMEHAVFIGSIRTGIIEKSPEIRRRFMELMQAVFEEAAREIGMPVAEWNETVEAPEHERSGRA